MLSRTRSGRLEGGILFTSCDAGYELWPSGPRRVSFLRSVTNSSSQMQHSISRVRKLGIQHREFVAPAPTILALSGWGYAELRVYAVLGTSF